MELPAGMFAAPKKTRRDGLTKIMLMKTDQNKDVKAVNDPTATCKKAPRKLPQFLRDIKKKYSKTNIHIGGIGRNRSDNKISDCDKNSTTAEHASAMSSHSMGESVGGDNKSRDEFEESSESNLQILQSFIDEEE